MSGVSRKKRKEKKGRQRMRKMNVFFGEAGFAITIRHYDLWLVAVNFTLVGY